LSFFSSSFSVGFFGGGGCIIHMTCTFPCGQVDTSV
jgi:hypothetical protein